MTDTTKLNKKLALWAGFTYDETQDWWKLPDKTWAHEYKYMAPDFTSSLDLCFKWLVPKISNLHDISFTSAGNCVIRDWKGQEFTNITKLNIEPSLALCLAIERLIDLEK